MKSKFIRILTALALGASLHQAAAQGTAFTYQGQLSNGGAPANGSYDLAFSLYNASTGGAQTGNTVTNPAVGVTNGLFTVTMDFGSVYNGAAYWLQIGVRSNGVGTFAALTPRQELTPTPYAVYAESAGSNPLISDPGSQNVFAGLSAGNPASPGAYNTAVGFSALDLNTGSYNSALGDDALNANTTGDANTANGVFTLLRNTTGGNNTALGANAMANNISGSFNTAVGLFALASDTTGSNNTAIGSQAMRNCTDNDEVAVGYGALESDTASGGLFGSGGNTAVGFQALQLDTTGGGNTALGFLALGQNVGAGNNTAVGWIALGNNTSGANNTATGFEAMSANTSGTYNTAMGVGALSYNQNGNNNTAHGYQALTANTGGSGNTAVGYQALQSEQTGYNNTALGESTLAAVLTGFDNVAMGVASLQAGTGAQNTGIGTYALQYLTAGSGNVALGYAAGINLTQGTNNIYLGNVGASAENNVVRLGNGQTDTYFAGNLHGIAALNIDQTGTYGANSGNVSSSALTFGTGPSGSGEGIASQRTSGANQFDLGLYTGFKPRLTILSSGNVGIGTSSPSSLLQVAGAISCVTISITSDRNAKENFAAINARNVLAKVAALPVTQWNYKTDCKTEQHIGPMAQDFQAAFGLNGGDDKHISMADEGGVALAAIQGLNQKLEEQNADLKRQNDSLAQQLNKLAQTVQALAEKK